MKREPRRSRTPPSGRTLNGAERASRKKDPTTPPKKLAKQLPSEKLPLSLAHAEFNLKQISDLMNIPRSTLYRMEEANEIMGRRTTSGATSKKVYNWNDVKNH